MLASNGGNVSFSDPCDAPFDPESALDVLCEQGYFLGELPEDEIVRDLIFLPLEDLSAEKQAIFSNVIQPMLELWASDPERFNECYWAWRNARLAQETKGQLELWI